MKFAKNLKIWSLISLSIIVIGLVMAMVNGVNLGIDFTGGTMMHFEMNQVVEVDQVKDAIAQYNINPDIIHAGVGKTEIIVKTKESLDNTQRVEIFNTLKTEFNLNDDSFLEAAQFGPTIGAEIQSKALTSILIASIGMLIYITLRFEIIYGISSIIALIHDVLILLAVYSIFNIPINSSFIAAVLTIVGYSINDTIVVFDRVRENVKLMKKSTYSEIADTSIRQTLTRSINTSFTTLLVIGSLYVLGVDSIREFAFPLMTGIIVGTYSSIFIASPIWATIKDRSKKVSYKKA
ncbi:MAG: protein translocase subunit SecF [Clostridiales bacterium]|nr:protein translocase subunit SecF [Clostridiales bacterium]